MHHTTRRSSALGQYGRQERPKKPQQVLQNGQVQQPSASSSKKQRQTNQTAQPAQAVPPQQPVPAIEIIGHIGMSSGQPKVLTYHWERLVELELAGVPGADTFLEGDLVCCDYVQPRVVSAYKINHRKHRGVVFCFDPQADNCIWPGIAFSMSDKDYMRFAQYGKSVPGSIVCKGYREKQGVQVYYNENNALCIAD